MPETTPDRRSPLTEYVAKRFDDIAQDAALYAEFLKGIGDENKPSRLLAARALNGRTAVCDIGCGPGVFAGALAAVSPATMYIGVDPSPAMIEHARRSHPGKRFLAENPLDGLSLASGSVDGVLVRHVLEHLEAPLVLLEECVRILDTAPGSLLVLVFSQYPSFGQSSPRLLTDQHLGVPRFSHQGFDVSDLLIRRHSFKVRYRDYSPQNTRGLDPRESMWLCTR